MVLVFHMNRRFFQKRIIVALVLITSFFIIFEIADHLIRECPKHESTEEPIDVVYTWVNGSDPKFLTNLALYMHKQHTLGPSDASFQRYDDKEELRYSLRSLERYAPWISHVYIVTNGQIPYWLNLDCERVTVVTHQEIFADSSDLPTFSSPAIELHLHRIPGLSQRFIYFNDDIFLRSPTYLDDFVSRSRGYLLYLAWLIPPCADDCYWLYVADGQCDLACNNPQCQMDGGDCKNPRETIHGDVVIKPEDYAQDEAAEETNYNRIISHLVNTTDESAVINTTTPKREIRLFNTMNISGSNVSHLISMYNQKVILLDKLRRRKKNLKRQIFMNKLNNHHVRDSADVYSSSLQHTNRMLNRIYGFSMRKVPSHAPILIDKTIMEEMVRKFSKEVLETSRNRIRTPWDLQFSFAYYYFVIHEKIDVGVEEIFDEFDVDSNGIWSENEVRTVADKLYDLPLDDAVIAHFQGILINCSRSDQTLPILTKKLVTDCYILSAMLKNLSGVRHKYKYELVKDAERRFVHFKMITSNFTEVVNQLDDVRKHEKKFVCLNDNLDPIRINDNEMVKRLMYDLYASLFPAESQFELSPEYRNRFSYIEDYTAMLRYRRYKLMCVLGLFVTMMFLLFFNSCRRRLCQLIVRMSYSGLYLNV